MDKQKKQKLKSYSPFKNIPFVLCFNKGDIFEEKLEEFPLKNVFNDYDGVPSYQARVFVSQKFTNIAYKARGYSHPRVRTVYTCGTPPHTQQHLKNTFENIRGAS